MPAYDGRMRVFLTLKCNLQCPYCVNRAFEPVASYELVSPAAWASAVNRIRRNVVFTGGEPFLYPGLVALVNGIDPSIEVRIYTNFTHDTHEFAQRVTRRVRFLGSYHPSGGPVERVVDNVATLAAHSRFTGSVHSVNWKGHSLARVKRVKSAFSKMKWPFSVDFDQKEKFAAMSAKRYRRRVHCTSMNFLVAPNGVRYPCVSAIMRNVLPQESVLKPQQHRPAVAVECPDWGHCAACDGLTQRKLVFIGK